MIQHGPDDNDDDKPAAAVSVSVQTGATAGDPVVLGCSSLPQSIEAQSQDVIIEADIHLQPGISSSTQYKYSTFFH